MFLKGIIVVTCTLLAGCSQPPGPSQNSVPDWNAPLAVDGVKLFVPVGWNAGRPWDPRPWPNGLQIAGGGWGSFTPWLGPVQGAEKLPPGQMYRAESAGQDTRRDRRSSFFGLTVTFEFPAPPPRRSWWGSVRQEMVFPFALDRLTLSYRSPVEEVERSFAKLLKGIGPDDGEDIGDGWRQLKRPFANREITLRFDAEDWRARGGPLPRRIAASFDPGFWSHFMLLTRPRWTAEFETQRLPVQQWRARYVTADDLFDWLQTPPERRDRMRRFTWWSDLRFRPAK